LHVDRALEEVDEKKKGSLSRAALSRIEELSRERIAGRRIQ